MCHVHVILPLKVHVIYITVGIIVSSLQIPEVKDKILRDNAGKWGKIAKYQSKKYFNPTAQDMKDQAKR